MNDDIKRQDALLTKIERPFRNAVAREKNRFIVEQSKTAPRINRVSDIDYNTHVQNMTEIFTKYYRRTIKEFSNAVTEHINEKSYLPTLEQKQENWEYWFQIYIGTWGTRAITQASETTKRDIQSALIAAQNTTEAVNERQLVEEILKVRGYTAWRADTIARTETHNAAMYASENQARAIMSETGTERLKKWNPALDERTRASHAAMVRHEPISMDAMFTVNGERLSRPGDPRGSAGNIINCRCVLTYVRKE